MFQATTRTGLLVVVIAALAALGVPSSSLAAPGEQATPAELAAGCIQWTQQRTQARVHANAAASVAVAAEIVERLSAGDVDGAEQLAHRAKERITRRTARSIAVITDRTTACAAVLLALGKPGLANQVLDARATALPTLVGSRQDAVATINAAFDG